MSPSQTPEGESPKRDRGPGSKYEPFPQDETLTFRQLSHSVGLPNIQVCTDLSTVSEEDLPLWLNRQLEIIGETFSRPNFSFFDDLIDSLHGNSSVEEILKVARVLCISCKDELMTNAVEQAVGRKIKEITNIDIAPETSGAITVVLKGPNGSVVHPVHLLEHVLANCDEHFIKILEHRSYIDSLVLVSGRINRTPLEDATNKELDKISTSSWIHHISRIVGMRPDSLSLFLQSLKKEILLTFSSPDKQSTFKDINASVPVLLSQLMKAHKDAGREIAAFILSELNGSDVENAPLYCALINQIQQIGNRSLVHKEYSPIILGGTKSFDKEIERYFSETIAHITAPVDKAIKKGEYDRYVELLLLMSPLMRSLEDTLIESVREGKIEQPRFARSFLRPQGSTPQFAECRAYIAERMLLAFSDHSKEKGKDLLRSFKAFEKHEDYWTTPINIQFQLLPHLSDEEQFEFFLRLKERVVTDLQDDSLRLSVLSSMLPKLSLYLGDDRCDEMMVLLCHDILKSFLEVPDEYFLAQNWQGRSLYVTFEQILGRLLNHHKQSPDINFEEFYLKHSAILKNRYWSDILREVEINLDHPGVIVVQEDDKVITVLNVGPGEQEIVFTKLIGADLRNIATIFFNPVKSLQSFMQALSEIEWAGGERLFLPTITAEREDGRAIIANFFSAIGLREDRAVCVPSTEIYESTVKDLISDAQTVVLPLLNDLIGFFEPSSKDVVQDRVIPKSEISSATVIANPKELAELFGDIYALGMESLTTPNKIILVETNRSEFSDQMVRCFTGLEEFPEDCLYRHLARHPDILILRQHIPNQES